MPGCVSWAGLVTPAFQAEGLPGLSSLCSAALLQNFRNFTSSKLLTQVEWAAPQFWHQWQREDRQLHDTWVLFLVNQAKIESGLILSSHLEPHQVENQTSGRCLEHKQLQPNNIWALAFLASDSKALCVSFVLVVCVMRSHFIIYDFLRVLIFQTGLGMRKAMCFLSKNTQRLQIYIWLEIYKYNKKKKIQNVYFFLQLDWNSC